MKRWIAGLVCLAINGLSLSQLCAQRPASHGYLGVGMATSITEARAAELKLKDSRGVLVTNVGADTPAAKAGLKESDVIIEFQGQPVENAEQLQRLVRDTPPGHKVTLKIIRDGAPQTLSATLSARPIIAPPNSGEFHFQIPPVPPVPAFPWNDNSSESGRWNFPAPAISFGPRFTSGIDAESLTGQLADYFGVKKGVLVRSVIPGSPAEKAGMRAGDVLVRVGSTPIKTVQEFTFRIVSRDASTPITLTVVRNHKELALTLNLMGPAGP